MHLKLNGMGLYGKWTKKLLPVIASFQPWFQMKVDTTYRRVVKPVGTEYQCA